MTVISVPTIRSRTLAAALIGLALLPAIYLLIAIQYAAITVPFWDHTELIRWIANWHEGHFSIWSLGAPHNHTRPFVYRLVMVLNAAATGWDLRSEYIYLYLSIYGTFACLVWLAARVVVGLQAASTLPVSILTISLLLFSPAGANNHWWSMMFQLTATNFFIALSVALVFSEPTSWVRHVIAAASCWLAAFTLTNGFFAMVAIAITLQLSAPRLLRIDRFAAFWAANLLLAAGAYLPGMHMDVSPAHPTGRQLIEFSLAYLGAPLGGLLWFPYRNMFDIPQAITVNVICGSGLAVVCAILSRDAWPRLRERHPAALVMYGFSGFAVLSALATGWARAAFDAYGVSNGNSSRYTIFGAYFILGQVYYLGAGLAQEWWPSRVAMLTVRRAVFTLAAVFVVLASISYVRGWRVYADAHDFNRLLSQAYSWGTRPIEGDQRIHPQPEAVAYLKRELQLLEIGPYANRSYDKVPPAIGKLTGAVLLSGGRTLTQRFVVPDNGLKRLSFRMVTPSGGPVAGRVVWKLAEAGRPEPIATGVIEAARIYDWVPITLKLPYLDDSRGKTLELSFAGEGGTSA